MYWPCERRCFWQSRPNYICYHLHLCISVKCLNIVHFPVSSLPHIQWLLHAKTVDVKVCPGHIQRNRRVKVGAGRSTPAAVPPYLCSGAHPPQPTLVYVSLFSLSCLSRACRPVLSWLCAFCTLELQPPRRYRICGRSKDSAWLQCHSPLPAFPFAKWNCCIWTLSN